MPGPREDLLLDRLMHEPGRLAILTVLSSVRDADFVFLQRATRLTKGTLSSHLTKLEEAGLVAIEKRFVRKKPNTNVALTAVGKQRVGHHWDQLGGLKKPLGNGRSAAPGLPDSFRRARQSSDSTGAPVAADGLDLANLGIRGGSRSVPSGNSKRSTITCSG